MNESPNNSPEGLLDAVTDRDTFLAFLSALITDRECAEEMERADPNLAHYGGARRWQNSAISAFLGAAAAYFEHQDCPHRDSPTVPPSWRDFAEFLYFGKIYE